MMKILRSLILPLALCAALLAPAWAQNNATYAKVEPSWFQQGKISGGVSVTNASAATALPAAGFVAWICNTGATDAYLAFDGSGVVATVTGSSWLKAGTCGNYDLFPPFNTSKAGFVAAITPSSTTTLTVETGLGSGPQQLASSGGGGGSVTQGTSPWVDNITQWGSATLGAATAWGVAPTGNVPGVNANIVASIALPVTGTFFQATQPISAASLPLPAGAATSALQSTINTTLGTPFQAGGSIGNTSFGATQATAANLNATVVGTGTFPVQNTTAAGENHIGEVGGNMLPITNDMTTSNNTVTTGKSIGGLQTLANAVRVSGALGASGTSGYIQNITVTFTDAVGSGPLDVYYFNASPSGSTCTDNTAFVLANADRDKVIGIIHVTDFTSSNTAVVAQANNQSMGFGLASATSAFACVVTRASFVIASTANASLVTRIVRN